MDNRQNRRTAMAGRGRRKRRPNVIPLETELCMGDCCYTVRQLLCALVGECEPPPCLRSPSPETPQTGQNR